MAKQVTGPVHEDAPPLETSSTTQRTVVDLQTAPRDAPNGNRLAWSGFPAAGVGALVLLAALAMLYSTVALELVRDWWDDANYSHGFLVPLFSGFLAWRERRQLRALKLEGTWAGFLLLLAGLGALILGDLAGENFLMRSSLIVVLAGLVLFHLGGQPFRVLAFPILFLFFMVPLPATVMYEVAFPLQSLAARNAAWVLDLLGVPVLLDGNVIQLSHIKLGVTEACSGVRSLISLLALGVAWAHLALRRPWAKVALVASVIPITVVANAARVVSTGLIAQQFGMEYAEGFFHAFSGWIIFLIAFGCLAGIHRLLHGVEAGRPRLAA